MPTARVRTLARDDERTIVYTDVTAWSLETDGSLVLKNADGTRAIFNARYWLSVAVEAPDQTHEWVELT